MTLPTHVSAGSPWRRVRRVVQARRPVRCWCRDTGGRLPRPAPGFVSGNRPACLRAAKTCWSPVRCWPRQPARRLYLLRPSVHYPSAVNRDALAGDETGIIRYQEGDNAAHIRGHSAALEALQRKDGRVHLLLAPIDRLV